MYKIQRVFSVSEWLAELGLGQYAEVFAANDINTKTTLLALTEGDLEKLGIESLGHRKQILAAIEELRPKPVAPQPPTYRPDWPSREEPAQPEAPRSSGSSVWMWVGILLIILLVIIIASSLGL